MNIIATKYRQLADAIEVEMQALARQRDVYRSIANVFDPPPQSYPPIVPPPTGPDPDFDDPPPEQQAPEQAP